MSTAQPAVPWVGVQTVSKVINPGEGLLRWANGVGLRGQTLDEARKPSQGSGTTLHSFAQQLAKRPEVLFVDEDRPLPAFGLALMNWWEATNPIVLHQEVEVESARLMVRGRIDLVRACDAAECVCHGEGAVVVDYKTGGAATVFDEAHLQGDGYREIWFDSGVRPRQLCSVEFVGLDLNGDWKPHPLLADRGDFLAALEVYRRLQRMRDRRHGRGTPAA